jgi:hypothetical protein
MRLYAWKLDGTAWSIRAGMNAGERAAREVDWAGLVVERLPIFDNTRWKQLTDNFAFEVGLRDDGTLWTWRLLPNFVGTNQFFSPTPVQIGSDSDWSSVACVLTLVATKTNGTLWRWNPISFNINFWDGSPAFLTPTRLGKSQDWVAVGAAFASIVSLAADGSLWRWERPEILADLVDSEQSHSERPLLAPSRRPAKIENIFANQQPQAKAED